MSKPQNQVAQTAEPAIAPVEPTVPESNSEPNPPEVAAGETVEVLVLIDHAGHKPYDVITLDAAAVDGAVAQGWVDATSAAVEFGKSLHDA